MNRNLERSLIVNLGSTGVAAALSFGLSGLVLSGRPTARAFAAGVLFVTVFLAYRHFLHWLMWVAMVRDMRSQGCTCLLVRGGLSTLYDYCPYHSLKWDHIEKTLGRKAKTIDASQRIQ